MFMEVVWTFKQWTREWEENTDEHILNKSIPKGAFTDNHVIPTAFVSGKLFNYILVKT